jgi:hypothetical protein
MWVETKRRIIDILKTLEAVAGTHYTVPDSTPLSRADHHGYLIWVRPNRDALQTPTMSDQRTHVLNFSIDCFSLQVLTGLPVVNEWKIEAYADAITALLEKYPRLESIPTESDPGRVGLTGVQSTFLNGTVFQTPRPYPDGNQQQQFYTCTVSLQVTFDRATGC